MTRNWCGDAADIAGNLRRIRLQVEEAAGACGRRPEEITVMAVTKTVSPERVNQALALGISLLGENRVQECCEKYQSYACTREQIHFIGHLQTNKIRGIIDKVSMIESVDSIHLAEALDQECQRQNMEMEILIQVNIGRETSKTGFLPEELDQAYQQIKERFPRLRIRGLMAIPPASAEERYFARMQEFYEDLRAREDGTSLDTLSMGMSGDFQQAIRFGSTQIRLGRALFGQRPGYDSN